MASQTDGFQMFQNVHAKRFFHEDRNQVYCLFYFDSWISSKYAAFIDHSHCHLFISGDGAMCSGGWMSVSGFVATVRLCVSDFIGLKERLLTPFSLLRDARSLGWREGAVDSNAGREIFVRFPVLAASYHSDPISINADRETFFVFLIVTVLTSEEPQL